jgi:uncharacterized phage protein gp47/JayE
VSLSDLIAAKSSDTLLAELLAALQLRGFPATDWQQGSVPRTLLEAYAEQLASFSTAQAAVAAGGFLDTATGAWLTLLAEQNFDVARKEALTTKGTVRLTAAGGSGPHTIAVGQLWVSTSSGKRFTNVEGGTLTLGGTLDLEFEAESPGSAFNVGSSTITTLITSLAGVTVNNPASPWITRAGTDEESDTSLRQRCRDRLPTIGTGATASAYRTWAQEASEEVRRVLVSTDDGTGLVSVVVAGDDGPVSGDALTDVEDYVADRKPLTDTVDVANATAVPVDVTATLYGAATFETAALAAAEDAVAAVINGFEIGGTAFRAALIEALMSPEGVQNVVIATPSGDTALADDEVATVGTLTLTWSSL